jgi:glutamate-1-semialdehyde 2,1-aminomutase
MGKGYAMSLDQSPSRLHNGPDGAYPDDASRSAQLYRRARAVMPSGSSRLTIFFKPYPVYARSGEGCRVTDEDGVTRVDFVNNYSSLIHGHRPPEVMAAVAEQLGRLTAVGLPTESEIDLAELLVERLPGVEQVRYANSGTEAVMLAIKAARAFTGRPRIAKIEGAYHGGYDYAEVSQTALPDAWGEAAAPTPTPTYAGQPAGVLQDVVVLPWNDVEASRALLEAQAEHLAGVLIDPLPSRVGFVPISPAYLEMLKAFTARSGALLILDEVYNLRLGYHGAQGKFGVVPDLTTLGKIIGGGFPVGAVGGRADIMSVFGFDEGRPRVPHGGTYNANPVTMIAGLKTLQRLPREEFTRLKSLGDRLRTGLAACLKDRGMAGQVTGDESFAMLSLSDRPIANYRDLVYAAKFAEAQAAVHRSLMNRGVLTSPALLFTLSTPMDENVVDFALEQVAAALGEL